MDFFSSSRGKKDAKKSGLSGKKAVSKSNPASPPHPADGRSPQPAYLSNKRVETEYDFPISDEQRPYWKQPASERVPNSHSRPPVYGYGTPERRRDHHGRERVEAMSYEPETNAPSSPFHPPGNRTPERPRKSTEYERPRKSTEYERREHQDRMYEADTRSNASPFHPFRSPSPSPYRTPDRRNRDHYEEAMYEPEAYTVMQKSAPASPFHPAGSRSPPPYRTPDRRSNHGKEQFEDMYDRDGDVTPRNSSPPSPFHQAAYRTPDRRSNHGKEQIEDLYEPDGDVTPRNSSPLSPFHQAAYRTPDRRSNRGKEQIEDLYEPDGDVTPRNSSPPSPFHPAAYRTPDRRSNRGKEQIEELYEPDGDVTPRNSSPPSPFHPAARRSPPPPPQAQRTPEHGRNQQSDEQLERMYEADGDIIARSPVHEAYYSSSDDDNHPTYLYPEIHTPLRSENSTPVHHNYQIIAAETYEQDKQFEPPELPDESQSFTVQDIAKMRGLKNFEASKEENQSMISEALVSVANYRVKASVSETLQAIIDKHGDIAAASKIQAMSTRSYYLESLAAVVMELKSTMLRDLTKTSVAEMAAVVKDMESVKIDVSWLKKAVTELAEAVEYLGQYEAAKVEREVCERDLKAVKGEMEEMTVELGKREKEIKESREKVTVVAGKLGQLEMKGSKLNKSLGLFHSKVDKFQGEAVLLHL